MNGYAAENLALRQQLAVYERTRRQPRLKLRDRLFWIVLSQSWSGWRSALVIVQPATVCRWHRAGFRLYWRWKSRGGRPRIDRELRELIRRIAAENPLWGVPRIQTELKLLGYRVAEATIAKYLPSQLPGPRRISSGTWTAFWKNHAAEIAAIDFFVVPTATFRVLYVFLVLSPDRRRVIHFDVTANPSAAWTAQQIVEAFPFDSAPKYLVRDNDRIYGGEFSRRVVGLGIREVRTALHSPWQNAYVERLVGTIRRECLDHVIVLNERHLKRILRDYFVYYHEARPHQSLDGNSPMPRSVARNVRRSLGCAERPHPSEIYGYCENFDVEKTSLTQRRNSNDLRLSLLQLFKDHLDEVFETHSGLLSGRLQRRLAGLGRPLSTTRDRTAVRGTGPAAGRSASEQRW